MLFSNCIQSEMEWSFPLYFIHIICHLNVFYLLWYLWLVTVGKDGSPVDLAEDFIISFVFADLQSNRVAVYVQ